MYKSFVLICHTYSKKDLEDYGCITLLLLISSEMPSLNLLARNCEPTSISIVVDWLHSVRRTIPTLI